MQRADNEGNFFFRFFSFFGSFFFILDNFSGAWQQLNRRLHGETEREREMQKSERSRVRESAHGMNLFFVSRRSLSSFARLLDFFFYF